MGIEVDPGANDAARGVEKEISPVGAKVRVLVVPTDEEGTIADDTVAVILAAAGTRS